MLQYYLCNWRLPAELNTEYIYIYIYIYIYRMHGNGDIQMESPLARRWFRHTKLNLILHSSWRCFTVWDGEVIEMIPSRCTRKLYEIHGDKSLVEIPWMSDFFVHLLPHKIFRECPLTTINSAHYFIRSTNATQKHEILKGSAGIWLRWNQSQNSTLQVVRRVGF